MIDVRHGDCREVLPTLASCSIDAVVCDPPYPHIKREYGEWTEAEWFALMRVVVPECMRVLKSTGSAVFILQPNSERLGRMRTWLWEFMLWVGKEYGIVQDVWWWNTSAMPEAHAIQGRLTRPGLKICAWLGSPTCWRDQEAVLLDESMSNARDRAHNRLERRIKYIGGHGKSATITAAATRRGGVSPFNVLPIGSDARWSGGIHGHGASTPLRLCKWWIRYICPPKGIVLDPFSGSGTTGITAHKEGRNTILIEKEASYIEIIKKRIADLEAETPLFAGTE